MTEAEAKRILGIALENKEQIPFVAPACEVAIKALEKPIAKEHHHTKVGNINDSVRVSICPSCLGLIYTHIEEYPNYCNSCGQKISCKDSEV